MGQLTVMDHTGDTKTLWNPDSPDEVAAVRKQFKSLRKKGFLAYRVAGDGSQGVAMAEFDPHAGKVIMTPAMSGG